MLCRIPCLVLRRLTSPLLRCTVVPRSRSRTSARCVVISPVFVLLLDLYVALMGFLSSCVSLSLCLSVCATKQKQESLTCLHAIDKDNDWQTFEGGVPLQRRVPPFGSPSSPARIVEQCGNDAATAAFTWFDSAIKEQDVAVRAGSSVRLRRAMILGSCHDAVLRSVNTALMKLQGSECHHKQCQWLVQPPFAQIPIVAVPGEVRRVLGGAEQADLLVHPPTMAAWSALWKWIDWKMCQVLTKPYALSQRCCCSVYHSHVTLDTECGASELTRGGADKDNVNNNCVHGNHNCRSDNDCDDCLEQQRRIAYATFAAKIKRSARANVARAMLRKADQRRAGIPTLASSTTCDVCTGK
jgi:hypothetical protein